MKKEIIKIVFLVMVLVFAGTAKADIVEVNLFDLGCPTDFNRSFPSWSANFDLGITFTEITKVSIDWSGWITAALAVELDPRTLEPIGDPFPKEVGIGAYIGTSPNWNYTSTWGGASTYPSPETFNLLSEIEASNWYDLLDGQNVITMSYKQSVNPYVVYVESGRIDLNYATLLVEGTVVPEPITLLLMVVGMIGVRARRKNITKSNR